MNFIIYQSLNDALFFFYRYEKNPDIRHQDADNLSASDNDEKTHVLYGEDIPTDAIVQGMLRAKTRIDMCLDVEAPILGIKHDLLKEAKIKAKKRASN